MPSYVYRCPAGHEVEEQRKIADRDQPLPCRPCAAAGHVVLMDRVPAAGSGPASFPGAASWRSR